MTKTKRVGYDLETTHKYTSGQEQLFTGNGTSDGATHAMEEEISKLTENQVIKSICDIGCGSNIKFLKRWLNVSGAKTAVGVEPSKHMLALMKKNKTVKDCNIRCIDGDWANTHLEPQSIDLAISRFSLQYLQDIFEGYRELSRILKYGGYAVISLPHPEYCEKSLERQGIEAVDGMPMSVNVFNTTLHYYYHCIESYLGENLLKVGLKLVDSRAFNWGVEDINEKKIPNTLLFVLKKISKK